VKYNKNLLKAELLMNEYSNSKLAKKLNISPATLSKKINGISQWKLAEIQKITNIVGNEKSNLIFFG